MSRVTLYAAALARVGQVCGAGTLGCYDEGSDEIVAIGQDAGGVTADSVVTHEYGHHIANSRSNAPWPAVDRGTKRWATYEDVCAKAQSGALVPGDGSKCYDLNPGEAFAEDYRVLNEREAALDLLAEDVTDPWTQATTATYRSFLGPHATGRGFRIQTPLDGELTATLAAPATSKLLLRIVDPATGKVLAAEPVALRAKSLHASVCGERLLQVQVERIAGSGPFTLTVSRP